MVITAAIDTVTMNHLLRPQKKVPNVKAQVRAGIDTITAAIKRRAVLLVADRDNGIVSEWKKTCSPEAVQQLVIVWTDLGGLRLLAPVSSIQPAEIRKKLRVLGFEGPLDKLVLRTAIAAGAGTYIVSIDSDFWDPRKVHSVGDKKAPVAMLIRNHFDLIVVVTGTFLDSLTR
jgi:hypothetical protein